MDKRRLIMLLTILVPLALLPASPGTGKRIVQFTIGITLPGAGDEHVAPWQPTIEYLEQQFGSARFNLRPLKPAEIRPALEADELHFLICDPITTAILENEESISLIATCSTQILNRLESRTAGAVFCAAERDDIHKLTDLAGKRLAITSLSDLPAWLSVKRELVALGCEPDIDLRELHIIQDEAKLVDAVLEGRVDVGVMRSGILEHLASTSSLTLLDVSVLPPPAGSSEAVSFAHSTAIYPGWAFLKTDRISTDSAERLAETLIDMPIPETEMQGTFRLGWAIPASYRAVHDCLRELELPPYANLTDFDLVGLIIGQLPFLGSLLLMTAMSFRFLAKVRSLRSKIRDGEQLVLKADKERERMVATAKQLSDTAMNASQANTEFSERIGHELLTPMNGVVGTSSLLLKSGLNDEQQELAELINASAQSLLTKVNNIMDYSNLESNDLVLNIAEFDLDGLIEEMIDAETLKAHGKNLEIAGLAPNNIPRMLKGDKDRVKQILLNLIDNSLQFTEQGEVGIRVEAEEGEGGQVRLRFLIQDTGSGIEQSLQDSLHAFLKKPGAPDPSSCEHSGLGLLISKQLAELMNAELDFTSIADEGTTFSLTCEFEVVGAPETEEEGTLREELQGKRVLVIDNSEIIRDVMREHLQLLGCKPFTAANGEEAEELMVRAVEAEKPIEIAILAKDMKEQSGIDLAEQFKQNFKLETTVLLLCIRKGERIDGLTLKQAGFVTEINKPPKADHVLERLMEALGYLGDESSLRARSMAIKDMDTDIASRFRILLAEDDVINQKVIAHVLQSRGFHIDIVPNGQVAVEAQKAVPFDLILMDIQMPVMDGIEATGEIRQLEEESGGQVPIIALTAAGKEDMHEKCLSAGMVDYIAKPIQPDHLITAIAKQLNITDKSISDAGTEVDETTEVDTVAEEDAELAEEDLLPV
ncbi:MAG: response regulator [bacterium]|nr:response regulator [bacterium]